MDDPLAFFITFSCHGTWLHGDAPGSVDRNHNRPGDPLLPPQCARVQANRERMDQPEYRLDAPRRRLVLHAVREVCAYRSWRLLAVHVRMTHVHAVVHADAAPERVMNDFKAYASRALNQAGVDAPDCKRWTRHGSTRYLWTQEEVDARIEYTLNGQGDPMERYPEPRPSEPRP